MVSIFAFVMDVMQFGEFDFLMSVDYFHVAHIFFFVSKDDISCDNRQLLTFRGSDMSNLATLLSRWPESEIMTSEVVRRDKTGYNWIQLDREVIALGIV